MEDNSEANQLHELEIKDILQLIRESIVKPLYKKGDKLLVENFNPLSLSSVFSKLIEKVILKNMLEHYNKHNILGDFQHGVRSGRSTMTATLQFILKALDKIDEVLTVEVKKYTCCNAEIPDHNTRQVQNYHMIHRILKKTANSSYINGAKYCNALERHSKNI
ncbi:uncharacterized protein LOC126261899 [Schistocerca nitens]|uniref:uncharacterized protein LOC126261899 n=1 Tax=Schistocerca nitens TaxID=7011 RepID=UPI00211879A1|nr:uncharacterized protein LOC126261899 [Schistocerca nitens]